MSAKAPWFDDPAARLRFEQGIRLEHSSLRVLSASKPRRVIYTLDVDVPAFDQRRSVRITLWPRHPRRAPSIRVDGPTRSKHRFANGTLCTWYPPDPADRRWTHEDGLGALIDRVRIHLWQEETWRRTGEWVGDEVDHAEPATMAA